MNYLDIGIGTKMITGQGCSAEITDFHVVNPNAHIDLFHTSCYVTVLFRYTKWTLPSICGLQVPIKDEPWRPVMDERFRFLMDPVIHWPSGGRLVPITDGRRRPLLGARVQLTQYSFIKHTLSKSLVLFAVI